MSRKKKNEAPRNAGGIVAHEPQIQTQEAPLSDRWPQGKPLPAYHMKRSAMPCPKCLRLRTASGRQAAVCTSSRNDVACYRCQACGHRWMLPVRDA